MTALQAFYDAYWFALEGRLEGVALKRYGNLPTAQSDALSTGLDAYDDFNDAALTLVADAGEDQADAASPVTLDASGSVDAVLYLWTESGVEIAHGESPDVVLSVATHTIVLHAIDVDGNVRTDTVVVEVTS